MEKLKTKNLTKQIICIIIVLMLCNFILPNYSYAVSTEDGGSLAGVIGQFLCFIPDVVIDFLQDIFTTPENIEQEDGTYSIKFSPGIIFSGQIPALDIDFINPGADKTETATVAQYVTVEDALEVNNARKIKESEYSIITKRSVLNQIKEDELYEYDASREIDIASLGGNIKSSVSENPSKDIAEQELECAWKSLDESKIYVVVADKYQMYTNEGYISYQDYKFIIYEIGTIEDLKNVTSITASDKLVENKTYNSSARILQPIIATWYNALRRIALVALLSVLVYIGIRILLSSTSAKDKAKYKSMLKDWFIALCLLFTIHYIMSLTITVVDKINEIVQTSIIGASGEDVLMTSVRNEIKNGDSWGKVLTYVVIYDVLAIYIIIYTIQYIRRVIHIAFLTAISPLITLTYPLDKIKDSKSQAFDMWLKDYMFFSLLQVVHLLIYYIFLGSSVSLNNTGNWLYAIVAIGFIIPAEKLIKKMFGFEKSKSMGTLTAGATGALVMNAMQELSKISKGKSSKEKESSSGGNTKLVRMATENPLTTAALSGGGARTVNTSQQSAETVNNPSTNELPVDSSIDSAVSTNGTINSLSSRSTEGAMQGNTQQTNNNASTQSSETLYSSEQQTEEKIAILLNNIRMSEEVDNSKLSIQKLNKPKRSIRGGAKALAGRYWLPATKAVAGATLKGLLGGTGTIIGFSAGVAQGDLSNAFVGLTTGGAAGIRLVDIASSGVEKEIPQMAHDIADTWREGAYGEEYVQTVRFVRDLTQNSDYRKLKRDSGLSDKEFAEKVKQMLDAGITDTRRMEKILKNHKKHPRKYSMVKAIMLSEMAEKCSDDILYNSGKFIRFCKKWNIDLTEEELNELREDIINFK